MRAILHLLRSYDWLLIATVFVLSAIGLAAIYSVDLSRGGGSEHLTYVPKQMTALFIGIVALFAAGSFQASFYQSTVKVCYALSVLLSRQFYFSAPPLTIPPAGFVLGRCLSNRLNSPRSGWYWGWVGWWLASDGDLIVFNM